MRTLGTASMTALLLMLLPAVGSAQSDICIPGLPSVPNEAKAEQLRIDAAERAQRAAVDARARRMRDVLDQREPVRVAERAQRVDVGGVAREVHDGDGLGAGRDPRGDGRKALPPEDV